MLTLASRLATRDEISLSAVSVAWGAEAGCTAGQPSIQPTPITNAAAAAPDTGAMTQGEIGVGEIGADEIRARAGPGSGSTLDSGDAGPGSGFGCSDWGPHGPASASDRGSSGFAAPGSAAGDSPTVSRGRSDTSEASRSMVGGARLIRPESSDSAVSSGLSSAIPGFPRAMGRA